MTRSPGRADSSSWISVHDVGSVDGDDPVAYADVGRGGGGGTPSRADDVGDHRDRLADAGGDDGPEEHDEGHEEVHPTPARTTTDFFQNGFPVGAADVLGATSSKGSSMMRTYPPAGIALMPYSVSPLDRPQLRPEPEEELGGFHAGGGSEEVAGRVPSRTGRWRRRR